VAIGAVVVLGALAFAATGISTGLSVVDQFREKPESVAGQQTIQSAFPAGSSEPASVIVATPATAAATAAITAVPGVASVVPGRSGGGISELEVVLEGAPGSEASFVQIAAIRSALAAVPGADAAVGGTVAEQLDLRDASVHDRAIIIPAILAVVLLVLILLLRALVAPVVLLATVVLSYAAALGASWLLFESVLGFPALEAGVPLFAFLFLVALGVDYNIFLVTRAREEATRLGTRAGMVRALGATGGVITSAGILLAAVFAVLGVLPLITLTQIGIIVGVGVLIDTLLVRTVLVPALTFLLGRRFWWPTRLAADQPDGSRPTAAVTV
jgi:RND superfamily putative drug exporter